jgi:hypothetical protein
MKLFYIKNEKPAYEAGGELFFLSGEIGSDLSRVDKCTIIWIVETVYLENSESVFPCECVNPVHTADLEVGQTYWLNGQTKSAV